MHIVHNQPTDGPFGKVLQDAITNEYSELIIVSAFAKNTGILAIKDKLLEFRNNGGKICAYIGIDLNGTSYEALMSLLNLVDHLYICRDSRLGVTFHPKVYVLKNEDAAWVAIGSNNLTHSGLYKNIECASIMDLNLSKDEDKTVLQNVLNTLQEYCKHEDFCIDANVDFIDKLLENKYISKEMDIVKNTKGARVSSQNTCKMFGQFMRPTRHNGVASANKNRTTTEVTELIPASGFWFETGKMTGGSRNILDLSKRGVVVKGDVSSTPYALSDGNMMGGASFFGINPEQTSITKDITISLGGIDYVGNTIKIETEGKKPNLSWRLQLKGKSPLTEDAINHHVDFVEKILLFQEIEDGYYSLVVLDLAEKEEIINASRVVAANGSNASHRRYGVLYDSDSE